MITITLGTIQKSHGDGSYGTSYVATPELAQQIDDYMAEHDTNYEGPCEAADSITISIVGDKVLIDGAKPYQSIEEYWKQHTSQPFPGTDG